MSDVLGDATGHLSAPKRYNTGDRETIDKMRDLSFGAARRFLGPVATEFEVERLADHMFSYLCNAQVIRYTDRRGMKDAEAQEDAKADWYDKMAKCAIESGEDPRCKRPGFVPYRRVR
jgi:hypothetical protein